MSIDGLRGQKFQFAQEHLLAKVCFGNSPKGGCDKAGAIVFSAFELIAGLLVMLVGRYARSRACSPYSTLSMRLLPTRSGPIQLPSGTVSCCTF